MERFLIFITLYYLSFLIAFNNAKDVHVSEKESDLLSRQKRFLIFNNGGLAKAVLGFSCPVVFNDNTKRSLNVAYNFQAQYQFQPNVTSPLSAPFFTGLERRLKRQRTMDEPKKDDSRKLLYSLLKVTMERRGVDGEECLLRAVCEVAESSYKQNGLFGELIDLIFTPQDDELGPEYTAARTIGLRGGNCQSSFSKCPPNKGLLDSISMIM
ncbi:uncharacterized protein LOC129786975 [Lutzomyia longipalpis]|uniref:uncharacterized protein LOC129786975 n=1 Tax=Lutzomyia longipalpis TaxID=7200 RepID=UPI002483779A|nr:uncharacterized protein LOC129786975 [Lutzomyia longipalpis]